MVNNKVRDALIANGVDRQSDLGRYLLQYCRSAEEVDGDIATMIHYYGMKQRRIPSKDGMLLRLTPTDIPLFRQGIKTLILLREEERASLS